MAEQAVPAVRAGVGIRWSAAVLKFGRRRPLGAFGGLSLLVIILIAIFAHNVATYDPVTPNGSDYRLLGPGSPGAAGMPRFWFGTDKYGRDSFSRIVFGSRISLYVGIVSVLVGGTLGTVLWVTSGYVSGAVDLWFQRLVDTMLGFPSLILAMMIMAALGSSLNNVVLAIAISMIPRFIRLARSAALQTRELDYVLAARALGPSGLRIVMQHVTPNSITPVIVLATGL